MVLVSVEEHDHLQKPSRYRLGRLLRWQGQHFNGGMVLVSVEEHDHLRVAGGKASPGPRGKTPGRAEIPLEDGRRRRHRAQNSSHARHVRVDGLPLVGPKREQVPNRVVVQVRALEADLEAVELLPANRPYGRDERLLLLDVVVARAPTEKAAGEQSLRHLALLGVARGAHTGGGERPDLALQGQFGRLADALSSSPRDFYAALPLIPSAVRTMRLTTLSLMTVWTRLASGSLLHTAGSNCSWTKQGLLHAAISKT